MALVATCSLWGQAPPLPPPLPPISYAYVKSSVHLIVCAKLYRTSDTRMIAGKESAGYVARRLGYTGSQDHRTSSFYGSKVLCVPQIYTVKVLHSMLGIVIILIVLLIIWMYWNNSYEFLLVDHDL